MASIVAYNGHELEMKSWLRSFKSGHCEAPVGDLPAEAEKYAVTKVAVNESFCEETPVASVADDLQPSNSQRETRGITKKEVLQLCFRDLVRNVTLQIYETSGILSLMWSLAYLTFAGFLCQCQNICPIRWRCQSLCRRVRACRVPRCHHLQQQHAAQVCSGACDVPERLGSVGSVRAGSVIEVEFVDFDVEYHPACIWDYVTIHDGSTAFHSNIAVDGNYRFCGKLDETFHLNSTLVSTKRRLLSSTSTRIP